MNGFEEESTRLVKKSSFVFLSLFIHLILLFFTYEKKSVSLGERLIPVEIWELEQLSSKGNDLNKVENKSINDMKRNIYEEEITETKDESNFLPKENTENILKLSKKKVEKKNIINPQNSDLKTAIGNEGQKNNNEIEEGSLKGEGLEKISCISSCRPQYPKVALRRGFQGLLILKLLIARSGEVIDVKVIQSTGYKILDKAGIESAKNSKYLPLKEERTITTKDSFVLNN